jgi:hypothetical protein
MHPHDCADDLEEALAARSVPLDAPAQEVEHWAVSVDANGENILRIESNCVSGRELTSDDEQLIRNCAHHLLAFVGSQPTPPAPSASGEQETHEQHIEWFKSKGFVQERGNGNWVIAWGCRSGYDFAGLEFYPLQRRANDCGWDAILGHHASGTNPRLILGTCENLADIQMAYNTVRLLNGYPQAEPERSALTQEA